VTKARTVGCLLPHSHRTALWHPFPQASTPYKAAPHTRQHPVQGSTPYKAAPHTRQHPIQGSSAGWNRHSTEVTSSSEFSLACWLLLGAAGVLLLCYPVLLGGAGACRKEVEEMELLRQQVEVKLRRDGPRWRAARGRRWSGSRSTRTTDVVLREAAATHAGGAGGCWG